MSDLQKFKETAITLVALKKEIQEKQSMYDELKKSLMSSYDELWVKTYEIEWTWVKITKKERKTVSLKKEFDSNDLMEKYPDYVEIKRTLDTKKLQKDHQELFETKTTEFVSVSWL